MADANVSFAPQDLLSLGVNFEVQASDADTTREVVKRHEADGDIKEHKSFNEQSVKTLKYQYNGTDLATDFTSKVGQVVNSLLITSLRFTFKPKAPVEIDIEAHNHTVNAHAAPAPASGLFDGYDLDLTTLIGAGITGWGVPAAKPWANANTDAKQIGLTLSYKVNHVDKEDGAGDHFTGGTFDGEVEAQTEYLGAPTLTTSGWEISTDKLAEKEEDADTTTVTGVKLLVRTVA